MVTFNNVSLTLAGKVCDSALGVMRYAKVMGTIVDSIFKRSNNNMKKPTLSESAILILEDILNNWRKELPPSVGFQMMDANGNMKNGDYEKLNEVQLTMLYLYYQAKALIYMPLMATESTNSKNSPSYISIQQATSGILTATKFLSSPKHHYYYIPLPMNIPRQKARFALLAAKGSLEYTRGGALFQEIKNLLTFTVSDLKSETGIGLLGCLSENCVSHLESAIEAIMSQPKPNSTSGDPLIESIKSKDKKKNGSSPLRTMTTKLAQVNNGPNGNSNSNVNGSSGSVTTPIIKKEEGALNDIFSSKTLYQPPQTLQSQKRQPQRTSSLFNTNSKTSPTEAAAQTPSLFQQYTGGSSTSWNPDNMGSYNKHDQSYLHATASTDLLNLLAAQKQQQQQAYGSSSMDTSDNSNSNNNSNNNSTSTTNSNNNNNNNGNGMSEFNFTDVMKSQTDLLMLNDFGLDASLAIPYMDFDGFGDDLDMTSTKKQKRSPPSTTNTTSATTTNNNSNNNGGSPGSSNSVNGNGKTSGRRNSLHGGAMGVGLTHPNSNSTRHYHHGHHHQNSNRRGSLSAAIAGLQQQHSGNTNGNGNGNESQSSRSRSRSVSTGPGNGHAHGFVPQQQSAGSGTGLFVGAGGLGHVNGVNGNGNGNGKFEIGFDPDDLEISPPPKEFNEQLYM
ncbi:unnamed protein product [Ambrosiozyma monospora]|uniref:Unnamed protein product n=1 Tax=Ambrosiozyma monospora TaxID=43982 RepID=A0ACB5T642_AMBMO|nr:unnamed protein product [Ambrosiozyma monospora]